MKYKFDRICSAKSKKCKTLTLKNHHFLLIYDLRHNWDFLWVWALIESILLKPFQIVWMCTNVPTFFLSPPRYTEEEPRRNKLRQRRERMRRNRLFLSPLEVVVGILLRPRERERCQLGMCFCGYEGRRGGDAARCQFCWIPPRPRSVSVYPIHKNDDPVRGGGRAVIFPNIFAGFCGKKTRVICPSLK